MARSVGLATQEQWYVPDVDGNRQDPEPFRVLIKPLSAADKRARTLRARRGKTADDDTASEILEALISSQVLAVEHYTVRVGERVMAPATGAELWAAMMSGPASELDVLHAVLVGIDEVSSLPEGAAGK